MFHKEGYKIIFIALVSFIAALLLADKFIHLAWLKMTVQLLVLFFFVMILQFFRNPNRKINPNKNTILAPVDGKVVVIEEVEPDEFYKEKRIQLSVFMSPANVHVNRLPIAGNIVYNKYHPGKFLVAWHPKSSIDNERWSVVIENSKGSILCKQIAGALARRICNYSSVGQSFKQCDEYGFIKFGSRVDILLPVGTKVEVNMNQVVKGGVTVLASWK